MRQHIQPPSTKTLEGAIKFYTILGDEPLGDLFWLVTGLEIFRHHPAKIGDQS